MGKIKIGNYLIDQNSKPFVIAEVGINHNGELNKAYEMIKSAKYAGADCVKFQTFSAEEFVGNPDQTYTYKSQGKEVTESMLEMFKRYEFARDEWFQIKQKCEDEGIMFLSTPQNRSDLDLLLEIGINAIKVGSDDFTNIPLLKDYSQTGLPLMLSCGMADLAEVYQALDAVGTFEGYPTILFLCTSQYPTPPEDTNLLKLKTLRNTFPDLILGFSDHTQGFLAASVAVGMGAVVFEKHFTLDNNFAGPDHWFSANPNDLKLWVDSIKKANLMLGDSVIRPTKQEREMRVLARRSIVAINDIKAGEVLNFENIGLKRPGNGLSAQLLENITGLKAIKDIKASSLLKYGDFE